MTTNEKSKSIMTSNEFKAARYKLGLSAQELADILNSAKRTVRLWEQNQSYDGNLRAPNPIAVRVLEWMLDGYRPPQFPNKLKPRKDDD